MPPRPKDEPSTTLKSLTPIPPGEEEPPTPPEEEEPPTPPEEEEPPAP
jgi:hypothetical protein